MLNSNLNLNSWQKLRFAAHLAILFQLTFKDAPLSFEPLLTPGCVSDEFPKNRDRQEQAVPHERYDSGYPGLFKLNHQGFVAVVQYII